MGDLFDVPVVQKSAVDDKTVGEARTLHLEKIREGTDCPLCHRYDKIYKRKLNCGMVRVLIEIYKLDRKKPGEFIHVLSHISIVTGGDYGKLVEWGLIEKSEGAKDDGNPDNGYYAITTRGKLFCEGRVHVPKYLYFYHDRLWPREDQEMTSVKEALGLKFNWNELMAAVD